MSSLKQKTIAGVKWSFIDTFSQLGLQFIIGVVLARILSPSEFGIIGMVTVFIAVSNTFVDSGFTNALIRKLDANQVDYSTVFYFNFGMGILFYLLLFTLSKPIADFYEQEILEILVKVLGLEIIISSLTSIQKVKLIKEVNFKKQAIFSITAVIISGGFSLYFAYNGYGVWSLVYRSLINSGVLTLLMWINNKWLPNLVFSRKSFKEMFGFGNKLLISGLLNTIYKNAYLLMIGKFYSAEQLGYYTRANQYKKLPSESLTSVIQNVSFPVLARIQNDEKQLLAAYRRLIKSIMLISFSVMIGLAATAKAFILTLIGEKWYQSIEYLQILCFIGMFYPLHALNLNMLKVKGRSDLYLRLSIFRYIVTISILIITVRYSIIIMIFGSLIGSLINFVLNSYYSGKLIGYSTLQQVKDILPLFFIAALAGGVVFSINWIHFDRFIYLLITQILVGAIITVGVYEWTKKEEYLYLKSVVLDKLKKRK